MHDYERSCYKSKGEKQVNKAKYENKQNLLNKTMKSMNLGFFLYIILHIL